MYRQRNQPGKSGFTLIEMLVVIAIIALLTSMIVPAVKSTLVSASKVTAINSLRQLGATNMLYATNHQGWFVPIHEKNGTASPTIWYQNEDFRDQLGLDFPSFSGGAHYPDSFIPRQARYARSQSVKGYARIDNAFGMNETGIVALRNYQGIPWSEMEKFGTHISEIARPSSTIQFGESVSHSIQRSSADNYQGEVEHKAPNLKAVAYRHNGKAAVVFYDNHTDLLGPEILGDNDTNAQFWLPR